MLQRARRLERDALRAEIHPELRRDLRPLGAADLNRVACDPRHPQRALRVVAIIAQQMSILLDHHAATARGDDDRFDIAIDMRPPCVDIAARERQSALNAAEVIRHRAATPSTGDTQKQYANPVEY